MSTGMPACIEIWKVGRRPIGSWNNLYVKAHVKLNCLGSEWKIFVMQENRLTSSIGSPSSFYSSRRTAVMGDKLCRREGIWRPTYSLRYSDRYPVSLSSIKRECRWETWWLSKQENALNALSIAVPYLIFYWSIDNVIWHDSSLLA